MQHHQHYQTPDHHHQSWSTSPINYGFPVVNKQTESPAVEMIERMASENAVVIFSMSTCCMCHAVKQLFCGMGVNPTVYELDEEPSGQELEKALMTRLGGSAATVVPVVFVGGKLVGSIERVMASHINGTLVPLLKQAGALWL